MASRGRIKRSLSGIARNIVTGEVLDGINGNVAEAEGNVDAPLAKKVRGQGPVVGAVQADTEGESSPTPEAPDDGREFIVKQEPGMSGDMEGANYELLAGNEFYGVDPMSLKASEESWCSCGPVEDGQGGLGGCLVDCDNRSRRVECDTMLCKAGNRCSNRAMQLQTQPLLALTDQGAVVATRDLAPGTFIGQYTGQVMTKDTFEEKLRTEYVSNESLKLHVVPLNQELVVDATVKGSICRLAAHSCSPNAEISMWKVEGLDCLAMYSVKDIRVNETITFNHSAEIEYLGTNKRCNCGSTNCKRILGRHANARGPLKCGACQQKLLEPGVTEEVLLHPELATPVCQSCSESQVQPGNCLWCCKPGKMLACSVCSKQFCKVCLKNNLGASYIKLAEHGSWTCLICDSRPLDKIRSLLWVAGEPEKTGKVTGAPSTPTALKITRPVRPASTQPRAPGVRQVRPATPRARFPGGRGQTPRMSTPPSSGRGGVRVGTPFPVRMLGQSSVSIERVPRPAAPLPQQQQRSIHAAAIINQLQRYSGLSIQPVSESASKLESQVKDVEQIYRILQDACNDARKISKDSGLGKAKEKLTEAIRQAKARLADVETKL